MDIAYLHIVTNRPEKNPPVAGKETSTPATETDTEENTEESGRKRRRGGKN